MTHRPVVLSANKPFKQSAAQSFVSGIAKYIGYFVHRGTHRLFIGSATLLFVQFSEGIHILVTLVVFAVFSAKVPKGQRITQVRDP